MTSDQLIRTMSTAGQTAEEAGQQHARVEIRETALVDRVDDHVEHASEPDAEVLREAEVEPCVKTD